jgi:hypothetical protein
MDVSIAGRKAKPRPIMDRAERERIIRANQIEVAAYRVLDDEDDAPRHANDNVAPPDAEVVAKAGLRTIKSFHRLFASKHLHTDPAMNARLELVGKRYRTSFFAAGGTASSQPPAWVAPVPGYDEWRQVPITPVDKCLPYHDAAKVLDGLEIRELVEAIVIRDLPIEIVGKQYTRHKGKKQAGAAAATACSIGLVALRNHYDAKESAPIVNTVHRVGAPA